MKLTIKDRQELNNLITNGLLVIQDELDSDYLTETEVKQAKAQARLLERASLRVNPHCKPKLLSKAQKRELLVLVQQEIYKVNDLYFDITEDDGVETHEHIEWSRFLENLIRKLKK